MKSAARAVFSAGSVLLLASEALATPTAQLSYARAEGAESCPGTLEVRKAVSQRLGYDPVDPSSPQIIAAIVERTTSGFRARVELISGGSSQGLRELTSSGTCAELVAAMALSMSIAIDPERAEKGSAVLVASSGSAVAEPPKSESATAAASPAASASVPPPGLPPAAPPASRNPVPSKSLEERGSALSSQGLKLPIDYSVGALVEVASGFAPATAAGGSLRVRGRHGRFSLSLEGRVDAPSGTNLSGGARVQGGLAALVVAPCVHYGPGFGCALGLGGEVWASSSDVSDARSDLALYGAIGARLGLDWPERGVWGVSLHADALRPLTRISIKLNGETVWAAPDLALTFGAGAVVRF